jgi:hypothetical protein
MFKRYAPYELGMVVAAAMSLGLALCSLLFAYAYTQDIAAILASPAQLWAFVCGVPLQRTATIPILVGMAMTGAFVGFVLLYVRRKAIAD